MKTSKNKNTAQLPILKPNVAGIDLGSQEHYVCVPPLPDGSPHVRVFKSTTPQLQQCIAWLKEQGIQSVAMESTGVYWIPLYELLELSGMEAVLVNARQLRHVPGRKTDMQDCQWIQLLHSCGLLRGSFRPSEAICRCRALTRQCANLVQERSKAVNWMQKALDQMNVQVHRAVTDMTGKTGMCIVRSIVEGERCPEKLASFRDRRCKKSLEEIAEHLTGTWKKEHLFNLKMALRLFDELEAQIELYEAGLRDELSALTLPARKAQEVPDHPNASKAQSLFRRSAEEGRQALWRFSGVDLTTIDGISVKSAEVILSEIGLDLTAFPSEKHFVSWLRLCPRLAISGGKVLKKRGNGSGANRISGLLRMASLSLSRAQNALGAEFRRIARRKSGAVAVFAIARRLAILIYRLLCYGVAYKDEGEKAYEERFKERRLFSLKRTAKEMGYELVESPAKI